MHWLTPSMILVSSFVVGGTGLMAGTAAPVGNCVAYANADMTGESVALAADRLGAVLQPTFTPKSIFLADGYAAHIYDRANFQGELKLIGGAADLAGDLAANHIKTVAGGHYLNLAEVWQGADVASYACVTAGTLVKLPAGSIAPSIVTYGEKAFSVEQFMNLHGNRYSIWITSQAVTVRSVQQDSGNGAQVVLDLSSGDITLSGVERDVPLKNGVVAKRPASLAPLSLAYVGAVKLLLQPVSASAFNNLTASAQLGFYPEANPELNEVLNLLSDYNYSL